MGERGPVPKRSSQRRRRNKEAEATTAAKGAADVEVRKPNSQWHALVKRFWSSLAESGQSAFYEPSDWAAAELLCESISRDLKPQVLGVNEETGEKITATLPVSGARMAAYLKAMSDLLVTEGARRRVRLELERPEGGEAEGGGNVSWIGEARRNRSGS